jgi:type I restriction enzyme S subunit
MERENLFGEIDATRNENKLAPKLDASHLPQLPNGWYWTTIGRIGRVKGGKRLPQGHSYSPTRTEFPYLRVVDFDNFGIRQNDLKYLTPETQSILRHYTISKDDVYISIAGTIGAVGVVPDNLDGANLTENAAKIILQSTNINRKYLCYWLASSQGLSFIASRTLATTQPKLALFRIEQIPFPLAPRPTQDQIVSEIEKQFTRLEAGVAGLRRVQANLERYRASVLKAACEGNLVPTEAELARQEGRTYETGAQLLERILAERRQNWQGRGQYREPAVPDKANLPPASDGWTVASIDQLATDTMIGLDRGRVRQSNDVASGVPYIKMNNVTMDGRVLCDALVHVPASREEATRFAVQDGDILFNTRNSKELVGKVGIVRTPPAGAIYNNNLMRIRLAGGVSPAFLALQMCSHEFRRRMELVKKATTNVAAVYAKDLLPLTIALPPIAEQERIVAEVERRLSVVEELQAVVNANLRRTTRLRQSILQKAFTGQLG